MNPTGRVAAPRQQREPLSLLCEVDLRSSEYDGVRGIVVRLRLPSYRSLPLSCLRELAVSVDGVPGDMETAVLLINNHAYRLSELRERTDLWWYVLDPADVLFAPGQTLQPGVHEVTASMSTIVPYATGGRRTSTAVASRRLNLDPPTETVS